MSERLRQNPLAVNAQVCCADARTATAYVELLGHERADVLFTDPPYCLLTRRRKGGDLRDPKGRKIDRDPVMRFESVREYQRFTAAWLPLAVKHVATASPLVVWTNFLGRTPILSVARELGYAHLWGDFVWAKRTTRSVGSEQLLRVYESALVLSRTSAVALAPTDCALPWAVVAGYDDEGEAGRWGNHPHHKPFGVLDALLRTYSRPGDLILDPFGGSGSIAAAALKLGRRAAVLEIAPEWAKRVSERLAVSV